MSLSTKYEYCEIVLYNDKQYFTSVHLNHDSRGFRVGYYSGIQSFTGSVPIMCDDHEKSILSVTIMPCNKVLLAIVECYDVPPKKFVRYQIQGPNQIVEIPVATEQKPSLCDNSSQENHNSLQVISTPGQSVRCAEVPGSEHRFVCGTCM